MPIPASGLIRMIWGEHDFKRTCGNMMASIETAPPHSAVAKHVEACSRRPLSIYVLLRPFRGGLAKVAECRAETFLWFRKLTSKVASATAARYKDQGSVSIFVDGTCSAARLTDLGCLIWLRGGPVSVFFRVLPRRHPSWWRTSQLGPENPTLKVLV